MTTGRLLLTGYINHLGCLSLLHIHWKSGRWTTALTYPYPQGYPATMNQGFDVHLGDFSALSLLIGCRELGRVYALDYSLQIYDCIQYTIQTPCAIDSVVT